jgi:hypothetical protein
MGLTNVRHTPPGNLYEVKCSWFVYKISIFRIFCLVLINGIHSNMLFLLYHNENKVCWIFQTSRFRQKSV